jgi:glucose/arabinose dehydrogenase
VQRLRRTAAVGVVGAAVAVLLGAAPASAGATPDVRVVMVARLNQPVGFTFTPAGRIVYLERATGEVRILDPSSERDRLWHRITGVDSEGERGALGVALHPRWPRMPYVYIYVSRAPRSGALRNQVLRLRIRDGRSVHREVLLNSPIGGRANHNGGRIAFGPDGKLYVVIGDGGEDPGTAQALVGEPRGKILRMNPDGSVPASNPFGSHVWSYGHRNSIGFAFDPKLGELWETENGPECNDEINLVQPGDNYGWGASASCPDTNQSGPAPRRQPEVNFASTIGITGAAFCDGCGLPGRQGDLVFGDCCGGGRIRRVSLDAARDDVASGPTVMLDSPGGSVLSMEVGPNGRIYFSDFSAIYRLRPA